MTELEFLPYQNYHIRFKLINGVEKSGVIEFEIGSHDCIFIETKNLIEWKLAERSADTTKMKSFEQAIDISNIVWAERIRF